jgi:uncharacterized protein YllA (UPF0747 family)
VSFRVVSEPIEGGALTELALSGAAPVDWYPPVPRGAAGWLARADEVRDAFGGRAWLGALEPALAAGGAAAERLERCAERQGVVVTTGQEPGLFGGPIYTWSKALSALVLADAVEAATGVATAPVFWAATDDTDFAEANWTQVAVHGGVDTLRLSRGVPEATPMSRVPLGDEVLALFDRLARGAGSVVYPDALERAREAYQPGRTVGDAYVALLRGMLEPLGIAVLDASHPATRAAARPILARALREASAIEGALAAREEALEARGLAPQVAGVPGLSLVFLDAPAGKRRVPLAEAAAAAEAAGVDALSPNVLLRPVVERAVLPTVGYMAGPGELAYFAQVSAVAAAVGAAQPLAVPRWSGTIVERRVVRVVERLGLTLDALRDPHAAERRIARAALPEPISRAVTEARSAIDKLAEQLLAAGGDHGRPLVPPAVVEGARRGLARRLDRLERRYLAAVKRHEVETMTDLRTAQAAMFPNGKRQERALNFLPFLARYGPAVVDEMRRLAAEHAVAVGQLPIGARPGPLAGARPAPTAREEPPDARGVAPTG